MAITLPFAYTQILIKRTEEFLSQPPQNFFEFCAKVGRAALAMLALIPILAIDLSLFAFKKIYHFFYPFEISTKIYDQPRDLQDFFKKAVEEALEYVDKDLYLELIQNDGLLENDKEAPVEIFQWCAIAYLVRLLRISSFLEAYCIEDQCKEVQDLRKQYDGLSEDNRKSALLALLIKKEADKELKLFIQLVEREAQGLTQNKNYLKNAHAPYRESLA